MSWFAGVLNTRGAPASAALAGRIDFLSRGEQIEGDNCRFSFDGAPIHAPSDSRVVGLVTPLINQGLKINIGTDRTTIVSDPVGHRLLYYRRVGDCLLFSTSLCDLKEKHEEWDIDPALFGSQWLAYFPLSTDCIVPGISQLSCGSSATISQGKLEVIENAWFPSRTALAFDEALSNALVAAEEVPVSLGLTGGLDSRTLLAKMLSFKNLSAHTFGELNSLDQESASRIADHVHLEHRQITPYDYSFDELARYCRAAMGLWPASQFSLVSLFEKISRDELIIDGSFGEVSRRQMLNRLLLFGRSSLLSGNPARIAGYIRRFRADIFDSDFARLMEQGFVNSLEETMSKMPSPREFGLANWCDLLLVRRFIPLVGAVEQGRLDSITSTYTPFTQSSVLDAAFSTPPSNRRNGQHFRAIIRKNCQKLESFPLVMGGRVVPYSLGTISRFIYSRMFATKKLSLSRTEPHYMLARFEAEIRALATRAQLAPFYDRKKITDLVDSYYGGNAGLGSQLDWFVSLELWRGGSL